MSRSADRCPSLTRPVSSPRERFDQGRSRRETVPIEAQAELPSEGRRDPLALLAEQDASRVEDLVPLRYGRMSRSPFTFLRGAAAVMASDLAAAPHTDLWVELCGDAHLGNFRFFKAPDRRLVFDLADFDETLPGPFEWDLKRLATSVMVVGRNNGFDRDDCRRATRATVRRYREFIVKASALSPLDLYYYRIESDDVLEVIRDYGKRHGKWKRNVIKKAKRKNSLRAFKKLTRVRSGRRMIVPDPPLVVRLEDSFEQDVSAASGQVFSRYLESLDLVTRLLAGRFEIRDVARKVVGVGSVGTRCFIVLLEAGDGTPLFLQLKQAVPSVLERYVGASQFDHSGQRVVEGQRLIQAASDTMLGWSSWGEDEERVDFYVRQLWDGKGKIDVEDMGPERLRIFGGLCGKTLAFAHARSGDAMTIHGYIGPDDELDNVILEFAERYADRTEADHAVLEEAIADGAIPALPGL